MKEPKVPRSLNKNASEVENGALKMDTTGTKPPQEFEDIGVKIKSPTNLKSQENGALKVGIPGTKAQEFDDIGVKVKAPTDLSSDKNALDVDTPGTKTPQEFEDIIEDLGSFGHWQRVIFFMLCIMDIFSAFATLSPVFTGATPDWSCANYSAPGNASDQTDVSDDDENDASKLCTNGSSKCLVFVYHDDFTSIVSEWDLICDKQYASDLITSIQMVGLVLGATVFAQLSDLIGRKKSIYSSFAIMVGFGFVSAFSTNWQMYAALRFAVGLGFGGCMVVNCVYPLEFVGQRFRTLAGTIGFWAIGGMLLSLIAYFVRDWRHVVIIGTVTSIIFLLTMIWVPESPRWLLQQGRLREAEEIVAKIARKNKKPVPDISVLKAFVEFDKELREKVKKYTYLDLFKTWKYAKTSLIMILLWFSGFIMYYELTYNVRNLSGDRYLNLFLSGLVDLVAMLFVILCNNILGRRKTMGLFLSIALASNLCLMFIFISGKDDSLGTLILVAAMVGKASALAATYICQIFSAELYPTVVRNLGVGIGAMAGRVGGAIAPQIVFLAYYSVVAPHIICAVLVAACLPVTFLLQETNGEALEDELYSSQTSANKQQENLPKDTVVTRL